MLARFAQLKPLRAFHERIPKRNPYFREAFQVPLNWSWSLT